MKLRTNLLLLVAGTAVPLLGLAVVFGYRLVEHEKETFRNGALDRNRAFMSAVDAEIRGHVTTLQALATSAHLERGDLRAFQEVATRAAASQPDWLVIILSSRDGQQLVNTGIPFGAELPMIAEVESTRRVIETAAPAVGDIRVGRGGRFYAVPVRVPVIQNGGVKYVLTAPIKPEAFLTLIQDQHFPDSWAVGLIDSPGRFIARVPPRAPGDLASRDFLAAVQRTREGWFRGLTLEDKDTFTAHKTSDFSQWTVGVAIPSPEIYRAAYRAAFYMALGAVLSIVLAIAFAYWMGRRISAPIVSLATAARALGRKTIAPSTHKTAIEEVEGVAQALDEAGRAMREREELRSREEIALRAADKAKDEFLAMLGHELRNPLSAISASAHVLRLAKPGEHAALLAHNVIERQTRQMARLVEDLLDVSRLAMGKVTLHTERFDLAELVGRVARTWEQAGRRGSGRLTLMLSTVWVDADLARIEQVITNLLDNAEKFSSADTAIQLRVAREADHAILEVSDQGEGIAPEVLGQIFDLFVQGPQDIARARGGMGLGLAVVKRLIEMHRGSVTAFSGGPGKGARFTVRLPAAAPSDEHHRASTTAQPAHRFDSRKILLVEDNDDARAMLEAMLALEGHDVRSVSNATAALAEAQNWRPNIVLADIGLPDMDGYELARRLRLAGLDARLKLVAVSGYGQPEDERRAYEAGFDLHLTKPVSPDFLRQVLAALTSPEPLGSTKAVTR